MAEIMALDQLLTRRCRLTNLCQLPASYNDRPGRGATARRNTWRRPITEGQRHEEPAGRGLRFRRCNDGRMRPDPAKRLFDLPPPTSRVSETSPAACGSRVSGGRS